MKYHLIVYFLLIFSALAVINCASKAETARKRLEESRVFASASGTPAFTLAGQSIDNSGVSKKPANTQVSSAWTVNQNVAFKARDSASTVYFINQRSGWVLMNDALFRTSDAGKTWAKLNDRALTNYSKIIFVTEQKGFAVRDDWNTAKRSNTVLTTEDGGRSWHSVLEVPTPIYNIDLITERAGYVGSRWQPIRYTNDGGRTWNNLHSTEGLNYLFFCWQEGRLGIRWGDLVYRRRRRNMDAGSSL